MRVNIRPIFVETFPLACSIPCFLAYASRFFLIFAVHVGSILGSTTVIRTTGGPLPILGFGMFAVVQPPTFVPLLVVEPPLPLSIQTSTKKPSMPPANSRPALLLSRFLSAGGMGSPPWLLASYGGGREVFRGGMARCMVEVYPWLEEMLQLPSTE